MKKRFLAVLMSIFMAGGVLAGCGSGQEVSQVPPVSSSIEIVSEDTSSWNDAVSSEIDREIQKQADDLMMEIDSIGIVTLNSGKAIKVVRAEYDNVSEEVQQHVMNIGVLREAERVYSKKVKEEADLISDSIKAIGTVTVKSKKEIADARKAYDDTTKDVQESVANLSTLEKAEKTYKQKVAQKKAADQKAAAEKAAREKAAKEKAAAEKAAREAEAKRIAAEKKAAAERAAAEKRAQQQAAAQAQGQTVYVTKTGKRYHYANPCGRGTYYPSTLSQAKAMGLTPCEKCVL